MLLEIAGILSLVVAIIALVLSIALLTNRAARSGLIFYLTLFLLLVSFSYATHASVEVFGSNFGMNEELVEQLYAVTSIVASLFVFFLIVIVRIISKLLIKR